MVNIHTDTYTYERKQIATDKYITFIQTGRQTDTYITYH